MNEEEDTSCCEAQDMSLLDDAMSDLKQPDILVPQVIVSGAVFVSFVLILCKSTKAFADCDIQGTYGTAPHEINCLHVVLYIERNGA
jgi:hypothetical protein